MRSATPYLPAWTPPKSSVDKAPHRFVYEINAWPWLDQLTTDQGRRVDLATVADRHWDAIAEAGFDAVWLMGVWRRSPAGVALALAAPEQVTSFEAALPGYRTDDVVGSPYCVRDYVVDERLGGPDGLAVARTALARRGLGLILDFVPNHVAPDHPWVTEHPEFFVRGTPDDRRDDPSGFVEVSGRVLANGRDPFFPAWPDVVQLNAFSPELRMAVAGTLRAIANQCDGVRCDMAMLVMNDIFERTWGRRAGARPAEDYWQAVIPAVRQLHPDFLFIAEAYWDLEWALQQQGFDYCYDKRLYDRLLHESAESVRLHLLADPSYQSKLMRFVENHDEPRAASEFDPAQHKATAVTTLTQAGARLVHHGQLEGWTVRLPVFLDRYPTERTDDDLASFYRSLLTALRDPTFRHGHWRLCERRGWPGNDSYQGLVAWSWDGDSRWLIVVNLSGTPATGRVLAPWEDLRGRAWRLVDPTNDITYERAGDELRDGLYVELGPWRWHLFRVEPTGERP
jgi:alpha amylase-like protein